MTALLLTACVGMITGAFLIFRVSPMDFTLGVFLPVDRRAQKHPG